jgi:hypothetical protein
MTAIIIGGVLVVAVAIVVAVTSLGGSKSPKATTTASSTTTAQGATKHAKPHHKTTTVAAPANAAEIQVAVLNGTETTGLAHRVSGELQQAGYSQAGALNGSPPGSNQVTEVEYTGGHQGDAESVAHSLAVTHVQPLESSVASLAGTASVVVIVGADKTASG